jgi:TonB family protein
MIALDIIAKTTTILLIAALLSLMLRRASAATRHTVWVVAVASSALLPILTMVLPQLEWSLVPQPSTSVRFLPVSQSAAATLERLETPDSFKRAPLSAGWILSVWATGVLICLARLVVGFGAARRLATSAKPAHSWRDLLSGLSIELSIRRNISVFIEDRAVSPMTWGLWRHTILLPAASVEWSEKARRMVLAHELAHVKRNDGLIQAFVQIVCSFYWFNPLVWYAAYRVRIERERACDDYVLRLGTAGVDYADHLIQIVRGLRPQRSLTFAAISMAQPSQLENRLVSILDSRTRRQALSRAGALALCLLAVVFTGSLAPIGIRAAVPMPPVLVAARNFELPHMVEREAPASSQRTRINSGSTAPNNAVSPPQVFESFPPDYTQEAVLANIEGSVTLEARVEIDGKIEVLRVVKGLGYGLDEKAIEAALRWKFGPAIRNGVPVRAITQVEVDFEIPSWYKPTPQDGPALPIGRGVTPPVIVSRVEPEYTPEARAAKYQGKVVVAAVVHKDGTLTVEQVVQELEYGLTPKAIEALEQWKFKPGTKDGEPVAVSLKIEVNFNLK